MEPLTRHKSHTRLAPWSTVCRARPVFCFKVGVGTCTGCCASHIVRGCIETPDKYPKEPFCPCGQVGGQRYFLVSAGTRLAAHAMAVEARAHRDVHLAERLGPAHTNCYSMHMLSITSRRAKAEGEDWARDWARTGCRRRAACARAQRSASSCCRKYPPNSPPPPPPQPRLHARGATTTKPNA